MNNEELQREIELLKKALSDQEQRLGSFVNKLMLVERKVRALGK